MTKPDIVAELDARIHDAEQSTDYAIEWRRPLLVGFLQRARAEIVVLRAFKARVFADVRDEALEEAATACIGLVRQFPQCGVAASAIRALKEKGA